MPFTAGPRFLLSTLLPWMIGSRGDSTALRASFEREKAQAQADLTDYKRRMGDEIKQLQSEHNDRLTGLKVLLLRMRLAPFSVRFACAFLARAAPFRLLHRACITPVITPGVKLPSLPLHYLVVRAPTTTLASLAHPPRFFVRRRRS